MVYVDDTYLQGEHFFECMHNLEDTVALSQALDFTIHPDKSQLMPTQKMTFLGFVIDSTKMILKLSENKQKNTFALCEEVIKSKVQSIRKIACLLGSIFESFEVVPWGPLYYRNIELCKTEALKAAKVNFEYKMSLSPSAKIEVAWWRDNTYNSYRNLEERSITDVVYTDARSHGCGATYKEQGINGRWADKEKLQSINTLELLAIKFAIKSFFKEYKDGHIRIMSDNVTAVAYINNMGGM